MPITDEQAEAVLEQIKIQFKPYVEAGYEPKIIRDWHWLDTPTKVAIVWEEGPFEWAYRAHEGGFDEELTALGRDATGDPAFSSSTPPAPDWPEGVWHEPVTQWAIALYLLED